MYPFLLFLSCYCCFSVIFVKKLSFFLLWIFWRSFQQIHKNQQLNNCLATQINQQLIVAFLIKEGSFLPVFSRFFIDLKPFVCVSHQLHQLGASIPYDSTRKALLQLGFHLSDTERFTQLLVIKRSSRLFDTQRKRENCNSPGRNCRSLQYPTSSKRKWKERTLHNCMQDWTCFNDNISNIWYGMVSYIFVQLLLS